MYLVPHGTFAAEVSQLPPDQLFYRTKDDRADYRFRFARLTNGTWRVYIMAQPSYGSRDSGLAATHRLRNDRGLYICWTQSIRTMEDAKQVAAMWAEKTQQYIATGQGF